MRTPQLKLQLNPAFNLSMHYLASIYVKLNLILCLVTDRSAKCRRSLLNG